MIIKQFLFNSKNIQNKDVEIINEYQSEILNKPGKSISCYKCQLSDIFTCFYLDIEDIQSKGIYYILALDKDLNKLASINFNTNIKDDNTFYKCVNLIMNVGVFLYYELNTSKQKYFPCIKLRYYYSSEMKIKNYAPKDIEIGDIIINYNDVQFNTNLLLNDIVRMSKTRICFSTTSENKDILYIIILDINEYYVAVRYYPIEIFNLYKYKFLYDMKLHLYKNFTSFGFSFYQDNQDDFYYNGLIIFGYANTTNNCLDLTNNNNIDINNIIIDLKNNLKIENNILGLVLEKIKINDLINCNNVILSSTTKDKVITIDENNKFYKLDKNENIKLEFINNTFYPINCILKYNYYLTEPSLQIYDTYLKKKENVKGEENDSRFGYYRISYEGKINYYNIILRVDKEEENEKEEEKEEEKIEEETIEEKEKEKNKEKEKTEEETIEEKEKEKNEEKEEVKKEVEYNIKDESENIEKEKNIEKNEINILTEKIQNIKTCSNEDILNGLCGDGTMKKEQVGELYYELKNNVLKGYSGENKIIQTENVIFQISTLEEQNNNLNPNISTIELGECENILKKEYNISNNESLIIFKSDIKNEELSSTVVQYELYHPTTKSQLSLEFCKNVKIIVNTPIKLDSNTISLYDSLSDSGYNLFDSNDDFYNDICSTYTSENGTDMTLEDRKKEIFSTMGNITICQDGCTFEIYNITTKKAKCNCDVQEEITETDLDKINFDKKDIGSNFLTTLTNSNFLILKCFKLVIDFTNFFKNKGRIIMSIILLTFISLVFVYIFRDRKVIHNNIQSIINSKKNFDESNMPNIKPKSSRKIKKIQSKIKRNNKSIKKITNKKSNKNIKNNNDNCDPPKNKKNKKRKTKKEKNEIINSYNKNSFNSNQNLSSFINTDKKNNPSNININIIPISHINYCKPKIKKKIKKNNNITIFKKNILKTDREVKHLKENYTGKNLNDQELNNLEYENAIIYDKRTYIQYYWSLLKKKHLILFTFLPQNDYNLFSLKLSLFLISFSLYFTINGFFFSDETMHKIHEEKGGFNIFFQIPQILYSSIASTVINMILKLLSLSEKNILFIKQQNNINQAMNSSNKIENCIKIKFIIFFILGNLFLLFFWYFISCFCAVYTNTQIILIKDTLISFTLSMIYPFGINLLPGIFRMPAIRSINKNKKLLYQISGYIALL